MTATRQVLFAGLALASLAVLPACSGQPAASATAATPISTPAPATPSPSPRAPELTQPALAQAELPLAVVHKSPTCGCCTAWVDHMRQAGFRVEVREEDDLDPIKRGLGVPAGKGSCHTAEIGGYVVEGHVPADDVKRLLREKPDAVGLVLPGMPTGSPGMEAPDGRVQPYTVELVQRDGSTTPYARHDH